MADPFFPDPGRDPYRDPGEAPPRGGQTSGEERAGRTLVHRPEDHSIAEENEGTLPAVLESPASRARRLGGEDARWLRNARIYDRVVGALLGALATWELVGVLRAAHRHIPAEDVFAPPVLCWGLLLLVWPRPRTRDGRGRRAWWIGALVATLFGVAGVVALVVSRRF
jgi:hypothetical protein